MSPRTIPATALLSRSTYCRRIACGVLGGALAFAAGTCFADEALRGVQIATTCASCHVESGPDTGIPTIAGTSDQDIINVMLAYWASETPSHVMHAVALSLSEEELRIVARSMANSARKTL